MRRASRILAGVITGGRPPPAQPTVVEISLPEATCRPLPSGGLTGFAESERRHLIDGDTEWEV
jgi:hypothetical protein